MHSTKITATQNRHSSTPRRLQLVALICCLITLLLIAQGLANRSSVQDWNISQSEILPLTETTYRVRIPERLRTNNWSQRSLLLYEDDSRLFPRVETLDAAVNGKGRFGIEAFPTGSFEQHLWISASDNSDPRHNGRNYTLLISEPYSILGDLPVKASAAILLSAIIFVIGLKFGVSIIAFPSKSLYPAAVAAICIAILWGLPGQFKVDMNIHTGNICWDDHGNNFYCRLPLWFTDLNLIRSPTLHSTPRSIQYLPWQIWRERGTEPETFTITRAQRPSSILLRISNHKDITILLSNSRLQFHILPPYVNQTVVLLLVALIQLGWIRKRGIRFCFRIARDRLSTPALSLGTFEFACLALLLLRFSMIRHEDVVAMRGDAANYAQWSLAPFASLPTHPIAPSLAAWFSRQLGLPWRVFAEIIYGFSCFLLCLRITPIVPDFFCRVLLFACLMLLPNTSEIMQVFLSETILVSATNLIIASILRLLFLRKPGEHPWTFAELGAFLLMWALSRPELPIILAVLAFVFIGMALTGCWREDRRLVRIIVLHTLPLLVLLAPLNAICWYHQLKFGIFAVSFVESPGLTNLMSKLYRIESNSSFRYAVVTRDMLSSACDSSPTMDHYRSVLLDPDHAQTRIGEKTSGVRGEPGPYLNWLLPLSIGGHLGLTEANWQMLAAAEELEASFQNQTLKSRVAFFPIDPNTRLWIHDLMPSAWSAFASGFRQNYDSVQDFPFDASMSRADYELSAMFDTALGRRGTLRGRPAAVLSVELLDARRDIDAIIAISKNKCFFGGCVLRNAKGQIPVHGPWDGFRDTIQFFALRRDGKRERFDISLQYPSGDVIVDASEQSSHPISELDVRLVLAERYADTEWSLQRIILNAPYALFLLLGGAGLLSFFMRPREHSQIRKISAFFMILTTWWCFRAIVIGLLDATLAWGSNRYMSTVGPIVAVCSVCLGWIIASLVRIAACRIIRKAKEFAAAASS